MVYATIVVVTIAIGGALVLIFGTAALVMYLVSAVRSAVHRRNWGGITVFIAALLTLSLVSYASVIYSMHGGFYFPAWVAHIDNSGSSSLELLVLPLGIFAFVGWLIPVIMGGMAMEASVALRFNDTVARATFVVITAGLWGFLGGSAWAGLAMGVNSYQ